jgi:hypothetical protein
MVFSPGVVTEGNSSLATDAAAAGSPFGAAAGSLLGVAMANFGAESRPLVRLWVVRMKAAAAKFASSGVYEKLAPVKMKIRDTKLQ